MTDHDSSTTQRVWNKIKPITGKLTVPAIIIAVVGAFLMGMQVGNGSDGDAQGLDGHQPQADGGAAAGEQTIWTCSMHPQIRQDEPGQCPICGMDLIPVEEGSGTDDPAPNRVKLTKRAKALARIRTTEVERADQVEVDLRLLGRLEYDERRIRTITSWTEGRIDRLHVSVTGETIRRGQVIATLYSPEIYSAQQDLIQAAKQVQRLSDGTPVAKRAAEAALESTRQRLRLLGVPDRDLRRMEEADRPFRHVPILAHASGTVIDRMLDEGAYVNPGTGIYRVADLSKIWVQLDAYERDLSYIEKGQPVSLTISAFPGERFSGTVAFIDPVLDAKTRTSQVRVEVDNEDGRLQPGMFAEALVEGKAGEQGPRPLVVPESAPLFTGRRSVVYVEVPDAEQPTYEAREVRLGPKMGEVYPVVAGLSAGERVVIQGAFTLDADLQIRGGDSMMSSPDDSEQGAYDQVVTANADFISSLEPVVGAYLNGQERLGEDDLEAAKSAMEALVDEVQSVDQAETTSAREAWSEIADALVEHGRAGAEASDIEAARASFLPLSHQIKSVLQRFGNPMTTALRVAYCPMAFDNRGAEWIQRGEEIDNSYFGATMRRCGEIRSTVEPGDHLPSQTETSSSSSSGGQGGHDH